MARSESEHGIGEMIARYGRGIGIHGNAGMKPPVSWHTIGSIGSALCHTIRPIASFPGYAIRSVTSMPRHVLPPIGEVSAY